MLNNYCLLLIQMVIMLDCANCKTLFKSKITNWIFAISTKKVKHFKKGTYFMIPACSAQPCKVNSLSLMYVENIKLLLFAKEFNLQEVDLQDLRLRKIGCIITNLFLLRLFFSAWRYLLLHRRPTNKKINSLEQFI